VLSLRPAARQMADIAAGFERLKAKCAARRQCSDLLYEVHT
jgi:hypothetical protein